MSDHLQRAIAEGLIVLLKDSRWHPQQYEEIDRCVKTLEDATVEDDECRHCQGHGYYYACHVDGNVPLASSVTECDCEAEAPKWLAQELEHWSSRALKADETAKQPVPWWRR